MVNNNRQNYIDSAINTIKTEIVGLNSLLGFFDDNYVKAVELILNCKGRVIVSGMGKSGHIANKMAATFASTGTPAFFIHPGEASHGDLGMIMEGDVVILLSNSGEAKELNDLIYYCKRFAISIIGIARKSGSTLDLASDIALILPDIAEANNFKAPTTSTTMMLALGDALAVSLIDARGFNAENYGVFHPGGKLGLAFLKAKELMRKNEQLPIVAAEQKMSAVLLEMTSKHLGCTAVVDSAQNLLGIITDGDLRRHVDQNFLNHLAAEIMTKNPITIGENVLAVEAVALMNKKSITNLFVIENQKVIGILHLHDCLRAGIA